MNKPRSFNASAPAPDGVEPVGKVRRSQLISTFGIGAIVDLEKGSFMPMGLEDWDPVTRLPSLAIREPRLEQMLKVNHFRLGPVSEDVKGTGQVRARSAGPVVRFPEWQECPKCHRIGCEANPFELAPDGARLVCLGHGSPVYTTPVRFVVACRAGHLNDFPWDWWAHSETGSGSCAAPILYLGSHGRSAALGDLYVECRGCSTNEKRIRRSLRDAFGDQVLSGVACSGFRPWLHDREPGCAQGIRTLQRGASNIHFATVCSALSIPPASEAICQILQEMRATLDGVPEDILPHVLLGVSQQFDIPVEQLLAAYRQLKQLEAGYGTLTEKMARAEEYAALSEVREDPDIGGMVPQFRNELVDVPPPFTEFFDRIGAVSRLREVRALAGFSRIEPYPVAAEKVAQAISDGRISPLSKASRNWLPAAEIRGEGIFLRFRSEAIADWIHNNPAVAERAAVLNARNQAIAAERNYVPEYSITARLLLIHSFSHALLRQISLDCGYSSSALRERLYISEASQSGPEMSGVLIYTGSPDSEGSLGGLVRLASPDLLGPVIERTLRSVAWCGSDPVCLETDPVQTGEKLSGAACHSCLLLPETACEKFNRELDRSVLAGSADGEFDGFFSSAAGHA